VEFSPGGARVSRDFFKTLISFALMMLAGYAAVELGKVMADQKPEVDREYILVITQPDKTEIGVVQAGLTKAQAEGVAFQLNEAFRGHGVPVSVRAKQQTDIGNYHPKPK